MVRPENPVIDTCVASNYLHEILFGDTEQGEDKKAEITRLINMTHTMNKHFILIGGGNMIAVTIEHNQEMDV